MCAFCRLSIFFFNNTTDMTLICVWCMYVCVCVYVFVENENLSLSSQWQIIISMTKKNNRTNCIKTITVIEHTHTHTSLKISLPFFVVSKKKKKSSTLLIIRTLFACLWTKHYKYILLCFARMHQQRTHFSIQKKVCFMWVFFWVEKEAENYYFFTIICCFLQNHTLCLICF